MYDISLQSRLEGSLRGVVVGDALGLPVEVQTRDSIVRILHGQSLVHKLGRIGGNGFYKSALLGRNKHADYRGRLQELGVNENTTGMCSDDTLLTAALALSIGDQKSIDMDHIMEKHLEAYLSEPFGFGAGTRTVLEKIHKGENWRSIQESSFGNGISMKQAPLAWYYAIKQKEFEYLHATGNTISDEFKISMDGDIHRLASITHNHPVALVAAIVQNRLLVDIILSKQTMFNFGEWLEKHLDFIEETEIQMNINTGGSVGSQELLFTNLIKDILKEGEVDLSLEDIYGRYVRKIADETRPQFNILSTQGIVYAIFMRNQDFKGLQKAASIGGDTDSYAATIGGMIGALKGPFYPSEIWNGILPRYRAMIDQGISKMQQMIATI